MNFAPSTIAIFNMNHPATKISHIDGTGAVPKKLYRNGRYIVAAKRMKPVATPTTRNLLSNIE